MSIKKYHHFILEPLSVHSIDDVNEYLTNGWTIKEIRYIDEYRKPVYPGYYTEEIRVHFIKPIIKHLKSTTWKA